MSWVHMQLIRVSITWLSYTYRLNPLMYTCEQQHAPCPSHIDQRREYIDQKLQTTGRDVALSNIAMAVLRHQPSIISRLVV